MPFDKKERIFNTYRIFSQTFNHSAKPSDPHENWAYSIHWWRLKTLGCSWKHLNVKLLLHIIFPYSDKNML